VVNPGKAASSALKLSSAVILAASFVGWRHVDPIPTEQARAAVSGRVEVSAGEPPPPGPPSAYARRRYVPPQAPGVPGGPEDAFVYLEPQGGPPLPAPDAPVRILQRDRTIISYATVAQVGQLVEFPNEDDVFHNLFSLSTGNRFSLGRYAPGVTETHTFTSPGVVSLFCDIHAEMAGVILVVATPYVVRVGADGSYRITGVPAGSYRAIAWHPTAGADTVALVVREEGVTQDFALRAHR
jgi:hypothetical protein